MKMAIDEEVQDSTESGPRSRVLIVDDEACISDLLSEMLRLLGYAPTQCFSPVAALRLLDEGDFDVILSDFRMPQMNGDELFHKAIARRPELAERFVFLTGDTVNEDTQLFLKEHSCPHLSKPFELEEVVGVITEVLSQQQKSVAI
jgi:CheY-like chemotaxis protein